MDDCELLVVDTQELLSMKRFDKGASFKGDYTEEFIETEYGTVLVARHGAKFSPDSSRHVIITMHDLGLNYLSNFQSFFNYHGLKPLLERMTVFHINAPGQEEGAHDLPEDYVYPTMDQMADVIYHVCSHYRIRHCIGLGVGVGANVLTRFAIVQPELIDGLFLVNPISTSAGWVEWAYQKWNMYYLNGYLTSLNLDGMSQKTPFPQSVLEYLIWHHFGSGASSRCIDLVNTYKSYFSSYPHRINPKNLALLIDRYIQRTDIGLDRSSTKGQLECSALIMCGSLSPAHPDTIKMNSRLSPERSTWMKIYDCGMPLDEQPHKVSQALILFIQGLGLGLLTCLRTTATATYTTKDIVGDKFTFRSKLVDVDE